MTYIALPEAPSYVDLFKNGKTSLKLNWGTFVSTNFISKFSKAISNSRHLLVALMASPTKRLTLHAQVMGPCLGVHFEGLPPVIFAKFVSLNPEKRGTSGRKNRKDEKFFIFTIILSHVLRDQTKW